MRGAALSSFRLLSARARNVIGGRWKKEAGQPVGNNATSRVGVGQYFCGKWVSCVLGLVETSVSVSATALNLR